MRHLEKQKNSRGGFTVIEMLIVMAITGILAGMLLGFNRSSEKNIALTVEREKVMSILGRARSLALQRKDSGSGYTCGAGVTISGGTFSIFIRSRALDSVVTACNNIASSSIITIESHTLERGISMQSGPSEIYFSSPYLSTSFVGATNPAIIKLTASGISGTTDIEVTSGGAITQKNP